MQVQFADHSSHEHLETNNDIPIEDPFGINSCLFREERLFPSWGGNQLLAAEMCLLPRVFAFRNLVRDYI